MKNLQHLWFDITGLIFWLNIWWLTLHISSLVFTYYLLPFWFIWWLVGKLLCRHEAWVTWRRFLQLIPGRRNMRHSVRKRRRIKRRSIRWKSPTLILCPRSFPTRMFSWIQTPGRESTMKCDSWLAPIWSTWSLNPTRHVKRALGPGWLFSASDFWKRRSIHQFIQQCGMSKRCGNSSASQCCGTFIRHG